MSEQVLNTMQSAAAKLVESTAPVEAPKTEATVETKPEDMSSKFAALAKKERYARMLSQQAKARAEDLARREAAIQQREQAWEEEFRSNPLQALKRRNLTYEDITNAALNDGKFDPNVEIKSVKDEIQRFKEEQEQRERQSLEIQRQAQAQAEAEVIEAFKDRITGHIEQNTEKYELTKLYDASDLVFQTVEEYFEREQKVLSVDEACALVEDFLESELERTSKESKKFQSKFLANKQAEDKNKEPKSSVTLNNSMNTSSAPSLLPQKTENDRIRRALAALGQ